MKKKFKMVDLDCANCAAKMEDAIKKIDGVNDATVSFMMQKLTIDADNPKVVSDSPCCLLPPQSSSDFLPLYK